MQQAPYRASLLPAAHSDHPSNQPPFLAPSLAPSLPRSCPTGRADPRRHLDQHAPPPAGVRQAPAPGRLGRRAGAGRLVPPGGCAADGGPGRPPVGLALQALRAAFRLPRAPHMLPPPTRLLTTRTPPRRPPEDRRLKPDFRLTVEFGSHSSARDASARWVAGAGGASSFDVQQRFKVARGLSLEVRLPCGHGGRVGACLAGCLARCSWWCFDL